ncbi:MAG TPA: XdhC family protein [Candidatus Deferrimicrobium sp.]|nr:XdhC family protein [Candidatus Deferrimicrobium sp.]
MDYEVLEEIFRLDQGMKAALATVIATLGSTPRKAGAQILFFPDGTSRGTIGGGCAEAEVRQQALEVIETGQPLLIKVNLTREVAEDSGMICGGTMEVFIEPILQQD